MPITPLEDDPYTSHIIYHDSASLHVYFALLVVIICGVIFYVVLKWRLKKVETKSCQFSPKSMRCPANTYSPLPQAFRQSFRHQSQLVKPVREGVMDSALQVLTDTPSVKEEAISSSGVLFTMNSSRSNKRFSELESEKKRALEASLNSSREDLRDWKSLAHQLSFGQEDIDSLASGDKHNVTRHLLQTWSKRDGRKATVGVLVMALIKIGRLDSAFLLDPTCVRSHATLSPTSAFFV